MPQKMTALKQLTNTDWILECDWKKKRQQTIMAGHVCVCCGKGDRESFPMTLIKALFSSFIRWFSCLRSCKVYEHANWGSWGETGNSEGEREKGWSAREQGGGAKRYGWVWKWCTVIGMIHKKKQWPWQLRTAYKNTVQTCMV